MTTTIKAKNVVSAIAEARSASNTMLEACKRGAEAAAKQLDGSIESLKQRIEEVMDLYKDDFGSDHNVKALFKDALTLFACAEEPVSVEIKQRGEEPKELHTTAEKAVDLPKHQMREAAKQVREANGMGRQSGAGRKPKQPDTKPTQVVQPKPAERIDSSAAVKDAWYDQLDALIAKPDLFAELKEHLKDLGIVCYRKAK